MMRVLLGIFNFLFRNERMLGIWRFLLLLGLTALPAVVWARTLSGLPAESFKALLASDPWLFAGVRLDLEAGTNAAFRQYLFSWGAVKFLWVSIPALIASLMVGGRYVQEIYELESFWQGVRYLWAAIFSLPLPQLRLEDGEFQFQPGAFNPLVRIGGPGYALIRPGSALLTERLESIGLVRAQGRHYISRFESIQQTVDLKDQHWQAEPSQAISKDGMLVTVQEFDVIYRLLGNRREGGITGRSPEAPFPLSVRAVRDLAYNRNMTANGAITEWGMAVQFAVDGEVLNFIRRNPVDAVTAPQPGEEPRQVINRAVQAPGVRAALQRVGTELIWVDIGHITVDDPVEFERIRTWGSRWEGEADLLRAKGEAARGALIEKARAEAQAELLTRIAEEFDELGLDALPPDPDRKARLFLIKMTQILEELRRPFTQPPSRTNP
ncbi:MAG: SPFH domain-containing protein [Anaerolineales bacterium]|jgi:hypothetical protein|nr:SPFH domain-containing protein [Anaerolineales bacterium]